MHLKKTNPSRLYSAFLVAGLLLVTPRLVLASDNARHRGSDDSSPEPSHSETPHVSPSPSASPVPSSDDSNNVAPSPSGEIESGSNEKFQVTEPSTKAVFKIERKQKSRRGAVSEDKFVSSLKVLVPTLSLGISNNDEAIAADVNLILSRQGTSYAECSFDFSSLKRTRTGYKSEYKVEVQKKLKKGVVTSRVKKGACDVNLGVDGVQSDLPNLQNGDAFTLEVNGISLVSGNL